MVVVSSCFMGRGDVTRQIRYKGDFRQRRQGSQRVSTVVVRSMAIERNVLLSRVAHLGGRVITAAAVDALEAANVTASELSTRQ